MTKSEVPDESGNYKNVEKGEEFMPNYEEDCKIFELELPEVNK
jgi:hypothetical protein